MLYNKWSILDTYVSLISIHIYSCSKLFLFVLAYNWFDSLSPYDLPYVQFNITQILHTSNISHVLHAFNIITSSKWHQKLYVVLHFVLHLINLITVALLQLPSATYHHGNHFNLSIYFANLFNVTEDIFSDTLTTMSPIQARFFTIKDSHLFGSLYRIFLAYLLDFIPFKALIWSAKHAMDS